MTSGLSEDTHDIIPTSAITLVETELGRLRRRQRDIDKKDLQAAMKYGQRYNTSHLPNGDEAVKYVYEDITYVVNKVTEEEVTCYANPIELDEVPLTDDMLLEHERARRNIQENLHCWTSNSVLLVDTSGSMREADACGTRTRLEAVWENLGDRAAVVFKEEACSWILYNKLIQLYNRASVAPRGHGRFLTGLAKSGGSAVDFRAERIVCAEIASNVNH